jgi:hypothetical protein
MTGGTLAEARDRGLNLHDSGEIDAPGLVHTDTFVEIPQNALFARLRDQNANLTPIRKCRASLSSVYFHGSARFEMRTNGLVGRTV